ncbi:MAG: efflux RND transporter periplasmic adaptor subunit [Pseudomonadota bacterium]
MSQAKPEPLAAARRRRWPWIVGVALVVLLAGAIAALWLRPTPTEAVQVQRAPLVRTLQFSARVATLSRVDVGATVTGRVSRVLVREGQAVRAGQVLVHLEQDELSAALQQARASERQAAARIDGLRGTGRQAASAAVAQAEAQWRNARAELVRAEQLVAQGFVSASRVDDARRAVDVAAAQRDAASAQSGAMLDTGTDVAQAQAQLQLARAATQAAQARLAQARITAPADARVLTRTVEPGQIVQPGRALLSLALAGPTQLVALVDERFLEQLRVGQTAGVVADAFPGQRFAARVLSLAPAVDSQRGAVEVKFALEGAPPAFLREDLTVSIEVETGRRDAALVIPLAALRGTASVLVAQGGRAQTRELQLGLRTLDAAEVTQGLEPGAQLLIERGLQAGQRVRPRVVPWKPGQPAVGGTPDSAASALTNAMGR